MERGFFDGAPGFEDLGFASVRDPVGAVVLAIGQHQFVGQAVEGAPGNAEVVGFDAVVFDAGDEDSAGPGGVMGAFGGE